MQRIYADGKENLELGLPKDWLKPVKKMNHRSSKRIITLINNIRHNVDGQKQEPRNEKEEGFVRLFICRRGRDKNNIEITVAQKMSEITSDILWNDKINKASVKTLILEHHMAARRMGFLEFFEPLYKEQKLSTGILDGTLQGTNFFTKIILPIVDANIVGDKFAIARIVKKYSVFMKRNEILKNAEQIENIRKVNKAITDLLVLWNDDNDPLLVDIIKNVYDSGLFPIPDSLLTIATRTKSDLTEANKPENNEDENEISDGVIDAWDLALDNPFSQIRHYNDYISEDSKFGTHQGVKGLEYDRVMVILDDEESRGFLFSYDKLFGSKDLSPVDKRNIEEGKETGVDRTRRLFYVACSRSKESLAIVAYTDNPEIVSKSALEFGWFEKDEIVIV